MKGRKWPRITRDGVLFVAGLLLLLNEALLRSDARPDLLIVFSAMMGLPVFLRQDERRKEDRPPPEQPSPSPPEALPPPAREGET